MIDNAFSFFEYSSLYVGEITLWITEPRLATSQSTWKRQDTAMDNYHEENCTFTFDNDNLINKILRRFLIFLVKFRFCAC